MKVKSTDKLKPSDFESKWPQTKLASSRKFPASRSRGALIRGKQEKLQPQLFEKKWQEIWERKGIYSPDLKKANQPYYNLMMFPYPSAEGLHVGNVYAFTGVDVFGRFMRMRGYDVFEPIGLDGFGIHSENYALKVGRHPKEQAKISEGNFYRQLRAIGNMFDWTKTVETYDPDYYRWTQWLFVQMFKHGLAYRSQAEVNWCPGCKTVLADEQVIGKRVARVSQVPLVPRGDEEKARGTRDTLGTHGTFVDVNVCERCGTEVEKRDLEQWFFKITDYAERLLQNTYKSTFKWPNKVKLGQRNWIGKKEGIKISYQLSVISRQLLGRDYIIECFTTRPDTNFGATFIVIAPEHPLALKITTKENYQKIKEYIEITQKKSKEDRIVEGRKKTGVFTGSFAVNQLNNYQMPIWVSDFVVMDVGTGAVVGVPGHDKRDFEFAIEFNIPIQRVVVGKDGDTSDITRIEQVQEDEGVMVNSGFLNGMEIHKAISTMMDYFEKKGWGKRVTTYHLRDWLISRQRYWGAPIPMIFCETCAKEGKSWFTEFYRHSDRSPAIAGGVEESYSTLSNNRRSLDFARDDNTQWAVGWYPVPEEQLPITLPDVKDWKPTGTGRGPLAGHPEFYKTTCPHCGSPAVRETDVCDTFLDSSWYYLRYPSVGDKNLKIKMENDNVKLKNENSLEIGNWKLEIPWDPEITRRWLPIDSYIGGAEHTVLHLLYTRFVWMALRDWGYLEVKEPTNHNYDPDEPFKRFYAHGLLIKDGSKMSKSKGNVVVPDDYIRLYGSDALRTYLMFLGPFDQGGDFRDTGIAGMYRWLSRVWRLVKGSKVLAKSTTSTTSSTSTTGSLDQSARGTRGTLDTRGTLSGIRLWHRTIKGVTEDLATLRYNTAIAKLMEFTNWWQDHQDEVDTEQLFDFLKLLAPFAPHMTEELWQQLKESRAPRVAQVPRAEINKTRDTRGTLDTRGTFRSIHLQSWPTYDPELVKEEKITIVIQVNGKIRDQIEIAAQEANDEYQIKQLAQKSAKVQKWLHNNKIKRTIFVPEKLINFVI